LQDPERHRAVESENRRIKLLAKTLFGLIVLLLAGQAFSEQADPWAHPEVIRAAAMIGLDSEQQPKFRDSVSEFLQGFGSDVQRLFKRNNQTDLPRRIASKRRARVKAMDARMAEFLSDEQLPNYVVYRDLLLKKMDERAANRR
jgi:hypothetical protein